MIEYFSEIEDKKLYLEFDDFTDSEVKELLGYISDIDINYAIFIPNLVVDSTIKIYYTSGSHALMICRIDKYEDEWYVVTYKEKRYKCDQFDGLLENLKKFLFSNTFFKN